jgi:hypothetical protein
MKDYEVQTVINVLKEITQKADEQFTKNESSEAYIIGGMQGGIKAIVDYLEMKINKG